METPKSMLSADNNISIQVTADGRIDLKFAKPMDITDFMSVMFTLQLQAMKQMLPPVADKNFIAIRDDIYDKYNAGASNVLSMFAPDNTLRPDITAEALKEAEDDYMKKKIAEAKAKGINVPNRQQRRASDRAKSKEAFKVVKGGK